MKTPPLTIEATIRILLHPARWRILKLLAGGEVLPVGEIARRIRVQRKDASKFLIFMRQQGVLERAYGSCYRLAPAFRPAPGESVVDLGPCLVKVGEGDFSPLHPQRTQ